MSKSEDVALHADGKLDPKEARVWEDGSGVFKGVPRWVHPADERLLNALWAIEEVYAVEDDY